MGGFTLPLTHRHCSVAQLSKHFHTAPSASSHRELSYPGPIWSGSAGTPRSLWQRATSWLCLRIRFYGEAPFPAEQILLQQGGDFDSPTIVSQVTFSHFYGFKSQLQSRSLSATKCNLALFPTCHRASTGTEGRWHSRVTSPVPQALLQQLFQRHLPCPCSTRSLLQAAFFPLHKNGGKALGNCVNSELTPGHGRAAQWQFGLSQCSGSRQAARKIKVSRPIRDSAWHVLLSTRINSTWNISHYLGMDCPAALLPPTVFLPLDYLHVTYNKKHHAFLPIV